MNRSALEQFFSIFLTAGLPGLFVSLFLAVTIALIVVAVARRNLGQRMIIAANEWKLKEQELQHQLEFLRLQLARGDQVAEELRAKLAEKDDILRDVEMAAVSNKVRLEEQERALLAEHEKLEEMRNVLTREFELLANRLFDRKQEHFVTTARINLEQVITPFHQQLKHFYQRIDDAHKTDSAQRNQLIGQIDELQKRSHQLSADALNLTNVLKGNNKVMGTWGEVVLARILEQSGLRQGREFQLQYAGNTEEGRRSQPDVLISLPDERNVVIDAKVSLLAYEQFAREDDPVIREQALKGHADSVKAHIRNLSSKRYEGLKSINSLGFVFMFIPIESAYQAILEHRPELIQGAYEKNVLVTGPSNLMVSLRLIESLWKKHDQDRNTSKIVDCAGKLYEQFVRFAESMNEIGSGLAKAQSAYDTSLSRLSEGRGNLVRKAEELKDLGASTTKSMPANLLDRSDALHLVTNED